MFLVAALAIIPVARLIGASTEHLAHYTGDSIGALLNTMFGNLPEIIIGVVALKAGLYAMVAASLVGAVLFNLLFVLGLSFSTRRPEAPHARVQRQRGADVQHDDVHRGHQPRVAEHLRARVRAGRSHDRAGEDQPRARHCFDRAVRALPAVHDQDASGRIRERRQAEARQRGARSTVEPAFVRGRARRQLRARRAVERSAGRRRRRHRRSARVVDRRSSASCCSRASAAWRKACRPSPWRARAASIFRSASRSAAVF